jgi:ribose-phosphate pyrophosphokinase
VFAVVTHGLFTGDGASVLDAPGLTSLTVTDSVRLPPTVADGLLRGRLHVVGAAGLFAQAIRRLHEGGSPGALPGTPTVV